MEATAVTVDLGGGRRLLCISVFNLPLDNNLIEELEGVFDKLCLGPKNNEYIPELFMIKSPNDLREN